MLSMLSIASRWRCLVNALAYVETAQPVSAAREVVAVPTKEDA
jgi:hypothetical protein